MHAAAIHAHHRLRQKRRRESQIRGHLPANQFIKLNLIRGRDHFAVTVIDFELRRRNFRMVFLVLEAHRALHFGRGIDESPQRVARQRVIISAGIYVLELVRSRGNAAPHPVP